MRKFIIPALSTFLATASLAMASPVTLSLNFMGTQNARPGEQLCLAVDGSSPTSTMSDVWVVLELGGQFYFAPHFSEVPAAALHALVYGPTPRTDEVFPCFTLGPIGVSVPLTWYTAAFTPGTFELLSDVAQGTQQIQPEEVQPGNLEFMKVGNSWQLQNTLPGEEETYTTTITRTETHGGEQMFVFEQTNSEADLMSVRADGVYDCGDVNDIRPCQLVYKYPVQVGDRFMSQAYGDDPTTMTVVSKSATVTVPAGTFSNCIQYQIVPFAGSTFDIYVSEKYGLIKMAMTITAMGEVGGVVLLSHNIQ